MMKCNNNISHLENEIDSTIPVWPTNLKISISILSYLSLDIDQEMLFIHTYSINVLHGELIYLVNLHSIRYIFLKTSCFIAGIALLT